VTAVYCRRYQNKNGGNNMRKFVVKNVFGVEQEIMSEKSAKNAHDSGMEVRAIEMPDVALTKIKNSYAPLCIELSQELN
jgi:hypothetical protein